MADKPPTPNGYLRRMLRWVIITSLPFLVIATLYVDTAYEFVPDAWRFVERRHPALDEVGTRAFTSAGIPGDPLNVAFVGSEASLQRVMHDAGWYPADPITLKSALRITLDNSIA